MKTKLSILFFLVVVLMFVGCNKIDDPSTSSEQSSTDQPSTSSAAQTSADYSIFKEPESAYAAFLDNLYSGDEDPRNLYESREEWDHDNNHSWINMEYYYALKDLDNDGTPELLIRTNWGNVAVYTFNDGLIKVGSRHFGGTRLFFSNNPAYPGIFVFYVGGGFEHYDYVAVKDNEFIYEELWNEDFSGASAALGLDRDRIEELSKDKGLIKESKNVYSKGNDIEWTPVQ